MFGHIRDVLRCLPLLPVVSIAACCPLGEAPVSSDSSSDGGGGGTGGGDLGPCGVDCAQLETPQCTMAVCNTGQVLGPLNTCIVVPSPGGTACDDGKFCTTG